MEFIFNILIKLSEEDLAIQLYTLFNQMHINVTWDIFLIMSKFLHKEKTINTTIFNRIHSSKSAHNQISLKIITKSFRKRSIKLPGIDDNILGEEIFFNVFGTCLDCKRSINLEKICDELLSKNLDKNNRFRCE